MADDTTSGVASPVPSPQGQPAQATSNTPPADAPTPKQTGTPAPNPTSGQQAVLDVEERIKRFQAQASNTLRQRDAQYNQNLQAMQSQLQQMKQALVQAQTQGMDEADARAYQADAYIQDLQAQLAQRDQQAAIAQANAERMQVTNQALFRIASKTQLPFDELQQKFFETGDADAVWEYALEKTTAHLTKAQAAAVEKAAQQLAAVEEETAIESEKKVDLGAAVSTSNAIPPHARAGRKQDAPSFVLAYLNNPNRLGVKK